jgi:hypothetical protein
VDELLTRPAYASYFALKWGDILRNKRDGIVGVGGKADRTQALHAWLKESFAKNKPYDQFTREILTATGDFAGEGAQPPVGWYVVLRTPEALVDDTAQISSAPGFNAPSAIIIPTRNGAGTITGAWPPSSLACSLSIRRTPRSTRK